MEYTELVGGRQLVALARYFSVVRSVCFVVFFSFFKIYDIERTEPIVCRICEVNLQVI
jgi:hypothetical protein